MDWKDAPEWANYKLTLEGGTSIWTVSPTKELIIGSGDNTQRVSVVSSEQRPEWKTFVRVKDDGKLLKYEAEGMITHHAAKRFLKEAGYDVRGLRFVLEYEQIV